MNIGMITQAKVYSFTKEDHFISKTKEFFKILKEELIFSRYKDEGEEANFHLHLMKNIIEQIKNNK